jgi:hypothetical protein
MDIKETFLKLTSRTYPHGKENLIIELLPDNLELDDFGNLFVQIGEGDCMFASHLDTYGTVETEVNHVFEGNIIKTDGKSILGADDKAGVTIMLWMMEHNIPGLYYFFLGEEVGCRGSKKVSEVHKISKLKHIKKVISFDKRGTSSVVTFQRSYRCCSEKFATKLSEQLNSFGLNFAPDRKAFSTDSYQFTKIYSECTNISVGYNKEHTSDEYQDFEHLEKLAEACIRIDWNSLPVERDPQSTEYNYESSSSYSSNWKYKDDYDTPSSSYRSSYDEYALSSKNSTKSKQWRDTNDDYTDWYDDYEDKKSQPKKKNKVYYDSLDNELPFDKEDKKNKYNGKGRYETLRLQLFDDELTAKDFEKIKDQYLDLNDPRDMDFYLEMRGMLL